MSEFEKNIEEYLEDCESRRKLNRQFESFFSFFGI